MAGAGIMIGKVLCALGRHRWQRRTSRETPGNSTYFTCRRCGKERDLPGPVWFGRMSGQ